MSRTGHLDPHCEAILQEYQDNLPRFREVEAQVKDTLKRTLADAGLLVAAIESRIKSYDSLAGKLELKGHKYKSLAGLTDILGLRVITFYIDDVDKVASAVERLFTIDWDNTVDKRKIHETVSVICPCTISAPYPTSPTALRYRCVRCCSTHGPTWTTTPVTNRAWRYPSATCAT
jgi:hypothetical protein